MPLPESGQPLPAPRTIDPWLQNPALYRRTRQSRPRFPFPAIETWQNQFPGYEILIDDPELTSVCPKTGLPDFGTLTIRYMPRERCLELKSLKEYLFSYRNLGIFQENIVNQVLEDVVKACDPVWAVSTANSAPAAASAPPSKPAGPAR
jgi:7-cyano-7-deazaguanine reductase